MYVAGKIMSPLIAAAGNIGIPIGSLPIRYLGLPLTTKTMTAHDYAPLIDQIRCKLLAWSTNMLSYAGRIQLINSVISSISNFWCSVFRLPVKCFDETEQLCRNFLWSGSPNGSSVAKVAWDEVCRPKEEGGLGIRRLRDVSRVFALTLIWKPFTMSGSLWVAWTTRHLMRSCSFWTAPATSMGSWIWRKLLKLRDLGYSFVHVTIGDGSKASFWYDHWLPQSRLIDIVGITGPTILAIPNSATVAAAVNEHGWNLSRSFGRRYPAVNSHIQAISLPNAYAGPDQFHWKHQIDTYKNLFSSQHTWDQFCTVGQLVPWHRAVWCTQSIPRCSFITWLAVKDCLSTGRRMKIWGRHQACVLCGEPDESRDHLFFACPYTFTVWSDIAGALLTRRLSPDWNTTLAALTIPPGTKQHHILIRLAFQVTIYNLWRERNNRIHNRVYTPVDTITRQIDKMIKNRIRSLNYTSRSRHSTLLQLWFATHA